MILIHQLGKTVHLKRLPASGAESPWPILTLDLQHVCNSKSLGEPYQLGDMDPKVKSLKFCCLQGSEENLEPGSQVVFLSFSIYLCLAALSLCYCTCTYSSCRVQYSLVAAHELLTAVTSVAEHRLWVCRLW